MSMRRHDEDSRCFVDILFFFAGIYSSPSSSGLFGSGFGGLGKWEVFL